MKVLLVILVCGAFDCHYERLGYFDSMADCFKAAGYNHRLPRPHGFKCVPLNNG